MAAPRIMLKIDAGTGVSDETLDQMTQELLRELTVQEIAAQPGAQPAPSGAKAGVDAALIGAIVLLGNELSKKLISKMADAIWEWGRSVHKRLKSPVYLNIQTDSGAVEITSNLSKDEMLNALRRFVESPE